MGDQEGTVGGVREQHHLLGEIFRRQDRYALGGAVFFQTGARQIHHFGQLAHGLVDRALVGLVFSHRHPLDGLNPLLARIQRDRQIRPVHQFEQGDALARQPAAQKPTDARPGLGRVKLLGAAANRNILRLFLTLARDGAVRRPSARNIGVGAAGHKRDRAELATFIVKRLARQTIGHDGA